MIESTKSSIKKSVGRPADQAKRDAIMEAASTLFLADGFSAVSMDKIAGEAGVAKPTIYRWFGTKSELFAAMLEEKCANYLIEIDQTNDPALDAQTLLSQAGEQFLSLIFSPEASALHRTVVNEVPRNPEFGQLFFESGIKVGAQWLHRKLSLLVDRGDISVEDPLVSARDLLSLWRDMPQLLTELGVEKFDEEQLALHSKRVTAVMLKAWAP